MMPEIRAARPEEAEAVLETLCAAFDLNSAAARPIFYADPYYDLSHKRVLALPDVGIVSCLTIVPTLLRIGGAAVPVAGVAGVATRPAFQHQGFAGSLLAATLPALWDELGYPLSSLHPVSAPFYRRLGWETASSILSWSAVPSSLLQYAEADCVRPATSGDWPVMAALHTELTRTGTGTCLRDSRRWALVQMNVPGREIYVYEEMGGIAGYVLWERGETLEILEMLGQTPSARRGLAGFLARQPGPLVHWPSSPALLAAFGFSSVNKQPEPDIMLRPVSLEASLEALHSAHFGPVLGEKSHSLTFCVSDALCPENARPLRLTPIAVEVGSASDRHWLRTDIQTLGPLLMGYSLPSDAHRQGLLTTDSPETLALADQLFPLRSPYITPLDQS